MADQSARWSDQERGQGLAWSRCGRLGRVLGGRGHAVIGCCSSWRAGIGVGPLGCVRSFRRRGAECNNGDAAEVGGQVSTASPGANWPSHVSATEPPYLGTEDRAQRHPPEWSRFFSAEKKKKETTPTKMQSRVCSGSYCDVGREGWWAVETVTASDGSWDLRAETGPLMSRGRPGLISQISQQGWEWNKKKHGTRLTSSPVHLSRVR